MLSFRHDFAFESSAEQLKIMNGAFAVVSES